MELLFYNDRFKDCIEKYTLSEEQLRFTGTPKECIDLSQVEPERYSILGMDGNLLVTFFVLHQNEGVKPYSYNKKAILLRAFSTDFYQQGKGYAKQALKLLPEFVKTNFPEVDEIFLAVNVKNIAAQELYKKSGFIDKGERRMGKKGELIIMSYHLEKVRESSNGGIKGD
ncbi:GNAT family N-acetyltransferase [Caldifermentibacillus hisashii]|uniref:GNAT family N-acetyltransferase n=1 Tax=Caldifermentibacillus hisashii TaxID=996558 RepID=UPI0031012929